MLDQRKKHALEILTIFIYASLLAVISYFHEPWFDEAQAWLIARDSSLFEMIWNVLRYEGHTPLWHLSLFIPAHLGVPFELGLKSVNFIFAALAAAVFIKYSPFPLAFRLFTPFTYFLFYQYGVIGRCYSLFMLILWLLAAVFPRRNERPYLFSILLALLGGVTAYGMLIVFGVALAWFIEITHEYHNNFGFSTRTIALMASDNRIHSLILPGLVHVFYVAILWPMPDKLTPSLDHYVHSGEEIYRLLIAPVGAIFMTENPDNLTFQFGSVSSAILSIIGVFLIAALFAYAYKCKIFLYGVLPYLSVALFMTLMYFTLRQTGIYTLLALFILWISLAERKKHALLQPGSNNTVSQRSGISRTLSFKKLLPVGIACVLGIQAYWSYSASLHDIRFAYAPYRELSSFIKENGIEGRSIFDYYFISNGRNTYFANDVGVLPYFSRNIFFNHNPRNRKINYAEHRELNDGALIENLKASAEPDFVIGHKDSLPFYDDLFSLSDYVPVKSFIGYYMWKDVFRPGSVLLYIRKDLLSEFPEIGIEAD